MSDTRWLSSEEQRVWRSFLEATRRLSEVIDQELQRQAGMPHAYYEILVRLSEAPNRALRMSELADASASSRSRLSHAVARLEQAGWVRRDSCPTDKRGQIAALTDAGYGALAAAAPGHVTCVRENLFDQLTAAQIDQLGAISDAVLQQLGKGDGGPPGCADAAAGEPRDPAGRRPGTGTGPAVGLPGR